MAYIYDLSDTWNAAGTTFFGIKMNVTNSASAAGSRLISLQVGGTELFNVDKNGNATVSGSLNTGATVSTGSGVSTGNVIFELGGLRTGNGACFIDFHGTASTDYEARMVRYGGTNGGLDIVNLGTGGITLSTEGAGDIVFKTTNIERGRITNGGNLLVGTTSIAAGNWINEFRTTAAGGWPLALNGNDRGMVIRNSNATSGFYAYFEYNGGTNNGSISWSGGTTAYNTTSDARIKDNIVDAPEAGDLIDGIKVRSWDFKADGAHWRYGMVAQELLEVAPEAVSVPADEDMMMGVDYSKLVPMLIKEVQSLRARVAQLEGA